jgi:hypothetical protein
MAHLIVRIYWGNGILEFLRPVYENKTENLSESEKP